MLLLNLYCTLVQVVLGNQGKILIANAVLLKKSGSIFYPLRFTGELIYGSSISSFAEESNEHKRLMRQLKYKKRTSKMVEKVRKSRHVPVL